MTTAALAVEERRWRRPDSSLVNLMIVEVCWPTLIKSSVYQNVYYTYGMEECQLKQDV